MTTSHLGWRSLADPEVFEKIEKYLYVTISKSKSGISYNVDSKRHEEILPLFDLPSPSRDDIKWSLQLLIAPQVFKRNTKQLPFSKEVIEAIQNNWRIAEVCFHAYRKTGSCALPFNPKPCDRSWTGFILRFMYSFSFKCTLAISHDEYASSTYGICFGIDPADVDSFLANLSTSKEHAYQPFLTPLLMTDMALTSLKGFSSKTYQDFHPVREAMGCNLYFNPASKYTAPDLSDMPRKLTALANAGASNNAALLATGAVIDALSRQLSKMQIQNNDDLSVKMQDYLTLMREIVDGSKRRNDYLRESVQAQVQMVYALLAQQDNALNHQYGADMRVIAAVTLFFLPGTFVATFFSASFWDLSPGNQGSMVSNWFWMYWVVTVFLTCAVLFFWRGGFYMRPCSKFGKLRNTFQ